MKKLPRSFYLSDDVLAIARNLLGKYLMTRIGGRLTGGIISETEAYAGVTDRASHAFGGRRTARTETMYARGGTAYVYFCYGMHSLFNVVTHRKDVPHAVLIRAIQPAVGIPAILKRRNKPALTPAICRGPGTLTQALGINTKHDKADLTGNTIWIEDRGVHVPDRAVKTGPRVGVDYAGADAKKPWRFMVVKPFR